MRLSSTVPAMSVSRASWPTSTWFITDTCMYAAMLAAFSTGRRLATRSKARWSRKASDHDDEVCFLLLNYALNEYRTAGGRTKPDIGLAHLVCHRHNRVLVSQR